MKILRTAQIENDHHYDQIIDDIDNGHTLARQKSKTRAKKKTTDRFPKQQDVSQVHNNNTSQINYSTIRCEQFGGARFEFLVSDGCLPRVYLSGGA